MTLEQKAAEVESVFQELDEAIAAFQSKSSLHCRFGCGKCCFKPDIEATVLEFLPFALHLYRNKSIDVWYEKLLDSRQEICLILNPSQAGAGLCTEYQHRGLICRLFGFSARVNKYNVKELVTCEIIKTEQQENYQVAGKKIQENKLEVPVMHRYYMKLHAIDGELARETMPINRAIRKAIETVLAYYAYRSN